MNSATGVDELSCCVLPGIEDDTQCDEDHGIHGVQVEVEENGGAAPSGSAVPRGQTHHQPVCAII